MADIAKSSLNDIRSLPDAEIERHTAGGSGNVGDTVYIVSDGDVEQADASTALPAKTAGIVVSVPEGGTTFVSGDAIDVAVHGRVAGFTGMTPGDTLFQSDTAGAMADAAGTVSHKVGQARSATEVFVNPEV